MCDFQCTWLKLQFKTIRSNAQIYNSRSNEEKISIGDLNANKRRQANVFEVFRNSVSVWRIFRGRPFQTDGPATAKHALHILVRWLDAVGYDFEEERAFLLFSDGRRWKDKVDEMRRVVETCGDLGSWNSHAAMQVLFWRGGEDAGLTGLQWTIKQGRIVLRMKLQTSYSNSPLETSIRYKLHTSYCLIRLERSASRAANIRLKQEQLHGRGALWVEANLSGTSLPVHVYL